MKRRGFALLTVLWSIVALGMIAALSVRHARRGHFMTQNRITLARAGWAREACIAVLHARYAADPAVRSVDSVDLGRGTWCAVRMTDPAAEVNVNHTGPEVIRAATGSDSLTDALLDWRDPDDVPRPRGAERDWYTARGRSAPRNAPLADTAELRLIRGFESRALATFTTRGDGRLDPNFAPIEIVAALPGMDPLAVSALAARRSAGRRVRNADEIISLLPPSAQAGLLNAYAELQARTSFAPALLIARVEGAVGSSRPRAGATLTLVPLSQRLAVVARESE